MSATLLEDAERLEHAVERLGTNRRDPEARKEVCIASRFVWYAVRSTVLFCSDSLDAGMARRILDALNLAVERLQPAQHGEPEDAYCHNVRDRLSGEEGIADVLQDAMARSHDPVR